MNHKVMRVMGILLAVMAVTAVLGFGINWARAEGTAAPLQTTAAQTGTSFTYQGKLVYNGTAVNGACDLTFQLYDAASSGANQIGFNQSKSGVPVSDGFFTVELDFGADAFSGDARYLQITIDSCPNGASSVTLSPNIKLTGAPYALGLRPGAVISGAVAGGNGLTVINSSASGGSAYTYGIYGQVNSSDTNATGVYGYASSSSGEVYGVTGKINTSDGSAAGVLGWSTTGSASGVKGQTTSSSQFASGVYGVTSNNGFGVWGRTDSDTSGSTGVYGNATAASGVTYGVYGSSLSASGYGVYSNGNAHVDGLLTWKPITSYISIPAAAFAPYDNSYAYANDGSTITPNDTASTGYLAEVQLPHGATIVNFTFYWTDGATLNGLARLYRINLDGTETSLGQADTHGGGPGNSTTGSSSPPSISDPIVDNSQYAYYIWLTLPVDTDGVVKAHGVVIEYTLGQPY